MKQVKVWWQLIAVLIMVAAFFTFLFYVDNKYQTPPPYGKSGLIIINEQDLERDDPVFLIDGWRFSDEREADRFTYIGEFSNLQRGDLWISPHELARYQLTIRYDGRDQIVSVDFPQLSSRYAVSLNGELLSQGEGSGGITFLLTSGDHVLTVETSSKLGYYSGMYFPPALSSVETLTRVRNVQSLSYTIAFLLPLLLFFCGGREETSVGGLDCCVSVTRCICFGTLCFISPCRWHSTGSWHRIWRCMVCASVWYGLLYWLPATGVSVWPGLLPRFPVTGISECGDGRKQYF